MKEKEALLKKSRIEILEKECYIAVKMNYYCYTQQHG